MYRCATGRSDITVVCGYRCASHHTWIHDGDLRVTIQSDDDGELLDTSKLFKQTGFRLFLWKLTMHDRWKPDENTLEALSRWFYYKNTAEDDKNISWDISKWKLISERKLIEENLIRYQQQQFNIQQLVCWAIT